jgi:hypothetical protein
VDLVAIAEQMVLVAIQVLADIKVFQDFQEQADIQVGVANKAFQAIVELTELQALADLVVLTEHQVLVDIQEVDLVAIRDIVVIAVLMEHQA